MSASLRTVAFAGLSILWCGVSVSAETLRCQSINGNLNCAGSSGASCQAIDGKTVCISRHGDVVQSFGNDVASDTSGDAAKGSNVSPARPVIRQLEQYHDRPHQLLNQEETGPDNDYLE